MTAVEREQSLQPKRNSRRLGLRLRLLSRSSEYTSTPRPRRSALYSGRTTETITRLRHLRLLPTLELDARGWKISYEAWKDRHSQAKAGSNQSQIASKALEIALKELEDFLHSRNLQSIF